MKVVLDTNILLTAIPLRSPYHAIIQAFNNRIYQLIITTPVFLEYEEILSEKANPLIANIILGAFLEAPNVIWRNMYYHWNLINADPDDNKFTDAYINGEADYLVTNDAHFNMVKTLKFPIINIVTANEFLEILKNL
jgi:putative PIN family toxin of toxin-antitoxin system